MFMLCGAMKTALVLLALSLSTGTSQAAVACQDHDVVCGTMVDICSDPLGPTLCPETCHACPTVTMTVDACQDHHVACSTVVDICSLSYGPKLCGKTCHTCSTAPSSASTTSSTTPPTTTHTAAFPSSITTPAAPSTVNATTPTSSPTTTAATSTTPSPATTPSTYDSSPSATSTTAATTTSETSATAPAVTTNTPPTTDNGSTTTPTKGAQTTPWSANTVYSSASASTGIPTSMSTAGKVSERTCFECGEETTGTFCTVEETELPRSYPCPEDMSFCMTDVYQHIDTSTKYIRRCVDEATCNMQWYRQTSGNRECVDFDPTTLSSNVTCRYCCTTDNCNSGIIPNSNTLYTPQP